MGLCFSKPSNKQILTESREMIETNARILGVCKQIAKGDNAELVAQVYDAVRYMTPTTAVGVIQADKKIHALAGDLKIALSKDSPRGDAEAADILKDLDILIAERNSFVN